MTHAAQVKGAGLVPTRFVDDREVSVEGQFKKPDFAPGCDYF